MQHEPQLSADDRKRLIDAIDNCQRSGDSYVNRVGRVVTMVERLLAIATAEGAAEEQKKMIERLRNTMDEYNSLPEDATQFAFYLKVADMKDFFEAITTKESNAE